MKYLQISIGIFIVLAASRFVPHPPNFTSLIALSFYLPALFGIKFLPVLLISFIITDLMIGVHGTVLFTWGSVILIGFLSKFFILNIISRISGALIGALLFFLITNFGVWSYGSYGYSFNSLIICYTVALPFFAYSLISTMLFATIVEFLLHKKILFKRHVF